MTSPRPSSENAPLHAILLDSVDSTNETAKRLVRDGTITTHAYVLSDEQTGGKGNRGRHWLSPKGAGIYVSVVDVTPCTFDEGSGLFTLGAGVACAEVLRQFCDVDVRLKPINDLYVSGKKLGGILTESLIESGIAQAIITGIGLNTRDVPRELSDAKTESVSLETLLGTTEVERMLDGDLVVKLVRGVLRWNEVCRANDVKKIRESWERYCIPGAKFPAADV